MREIGEKRRKGKAGEQKKDGKESKEEREVKRKKLKKDIHLFYVSRFPAKRIILRTEAVAWALVLLTFFPWISQQR